MPASCPFAWLLAWLEFDLCVQTGVDGTPRFRPPRPGYRCPWAGRGGASVKPQNELRLFLEHLFFTKEGNIFILKKCDGVRCAEFRRFLKTQDETLKEALTLHRGEPHTPPASITKPRGAVQMLCHHGGFRTYEEEVPWGGGGRCGG